MSIDGRREWIVLLEAEAGRGGAPLDRCGFGRLVSSWSGPAPVTLFSEDRYAVQIPVVACEPQAALTGALGLWRDALRLSGLPRWELVRVEVVTPEELARELDEADRETPAVAPPRPNESSSDPVGEELLRRAFLDEVTGLPGREVFLDEVRRRLDGDREQPGAHAVVVVDVDGQDLIGEDGAAATGTMADLANKLVHTVRGDDCVARTGPAQLALLVALPSDSDVGAVVDRVAEALAGPQPGSGGPVTGAVRVGMATTSLDTDADELLAAAERAITKVPVTSRQTPEKVSFKAPAL